ncbi:hypothetical protein Anas_05244 [Armadillidium nasatum]|uniref:Uncharacterized protein n=1 Tax=Armadillidium nasatum TaxID=96803 RepID=A0A5N5T3W5_9CRUS|nr:hypothetical protein Anas_05244 [Armadillidium nasatum]
MAKKPDSCYKKETNSFPISIIFFIFNINLTRSGERYYLVSGRKSSLTYFNGMTCITEYIDKTSQFNGISSGRQG